MYAFCGWRKKRFGKLAAPLFWQLIHSPRIQDGGTHFNAVVHPVHIYAKKVFDLCIIRPIEHVQSRHYWILFIFLAFIFFSED